MYSLNEISTRIKISAKKKGISINQMLKDCELGKNSIDKMSNGSDMYSLNFAKIADYLNVSVDYLLGRTDIPTVSTANSIVIPIASRDGGVVYKKYSTEEYFKLKEKYPELLEAVTDDTLTLDE